MLCVVGGRRPTGAPPGSVAASCVSLWSRNRQRLVALRQCYWCLLQRAVLTRSKDSAKTMVTVWVGLGIGQFQVSILLSLLTCICVNCNLLLLMCTCSSQAQSKVVERYKTKSGSQSFPRCTIQLLLVVLFVARNMDLHDFSTLTALDERQMLQYFQDHGLLHSKLHHIPCNRDYSIIMWKTGAIGYVFRCAGCRTKHKLTADTILECSKLTLIRWRSFCRWCFSGHTACVLTLRRLCLECLQQQLCRGISISGQ